MGITPTVNRSPVIWSRFSSNEFGMLDICMKFGLLFLCAVFALVPPVSADELSDSDNDKLELSDAEKEQLEFALGEPERCVSLHRIRSTDVIDDQNILFNMKGGKIYRNHLPRKCHGLKIIWRCTEL